MFIIEVLDRINKYLEKLELSETRSYSQKLTSLNLNGVAEYLKNCKNVICMIGAGISTCKFVSFSYGQCALFLICLFKAAGIPDFRSPNTGLYSKLQEFDLPEPEAVFDLSYFRVSFIRVQHYTPTLQLNQILTGKSKTIF
jgi:hypothetical protein